MNSQTSFKKLISKNWKLKKSWQLLLMESFASFVIVWFLIWPGAWNNPTTQLSGFFEVINEVNLLMPLWIVLVTFYFSMFFRKFGAFSTPLPLAYAKAKRNITWKDVGMKAFFQAMGAFAAAWLMYYSVVWMGEFIPEKSSLGQIGATVKGFTWSGNGGITIHETWFYIVQFLIALGAIVAAVLLNVVIEKATKQQKALRTYWRIILTYTLVWFSFHVNAHPVNLWRIMAPAIVGNYVGAANEMATMYALMFAHVIGFIFIFKLYDWIHVNNISRQLSNTKMYHELITR